MTDGEPTSGHNDVSLVGSPEGAFREKFRRPHFHLW